MKIKKLTILFFIIFIVISFGLVKKIILQSQYVPWINKYLNKCNPSEEGIYEDQIYHHTLPRCGKYIDRDFISSQQNKEELDLEIKVSINSLGFRNKEYNVKKDNNTLRIILLGDSFVYGFGLNQDDTFYILLEEELNKKYEKNIEVWNIGVPSWSTVIQYLVVKNKLELYSPDLVILFFDESDTLDNLFYESQSKMENNISIAVSPNIEDWYNKRGEAYLKIINQSNLNQTKMRLIDLSVFYLSNINNILQNRGVPFEVVLYPYINSTYENFYQDNIFKELDNSNISYLNLYKVIQEEDIKEYYSKTNRHWNRLGSKYVEGLVFNYMTEKYPLIFS